MIVLSQYSVVAKSRTKLYRRVISYWRQPANKGRPTTRTYAAWVITTLHRDRDVDVRSARTRRNTHEQRTKVVVMSVKVKWAHHSHLHGETSDDRDSEPLRLPPSLAISGLWQAGDSFPPDIPRSETRFTFHWASQEDDSPTMWLRRVTPPPPTPRIEQTILNFSNHPLTATPHLCFSHPGHINYTRRLFPQSQYQ